MEWFTEVTALTGLAAMAVQEILKLKIVPLAFANKYPVPTNILLSIAGAVLVVWQTDVQPADWQGWVLLVATVSVVAAGVYNVLLRNWTQLRSMEGES